MVWCVVTPWLCCYKNHRILIYNAQVPECFVRMWHGSFVSIIPPLGNMLQYDGSFSCFFPPLLIITICWPLTFWCVHIQNLAPNMIHDLWSMFTIGLSVCLFWRIMQFIANTVCVHESFLPLFVNFSLVYRLVFKLGCDSRNLARFESYPSNRFNPPTTITRYVFTCRYLLLSRSVVLMFDP